MSELLSGGAVEEEVDGVVGVHQQRRGGTRQLEGGRGAQTDVRRRVHEGGDDERHVHRQGGDEEGEGDGE